MQNMTRRLAQAGYVAAAPDLYHRDGPELNRLNKPHEFCSYPDAGHAFMDSTKETYRRHAQGASWPRTLEFLGRHLSAPAHQRTAATR